MTRAHLTRIGFRFLVASMALRASAGCGGSIAPGDDSPGAVGGALDSGNADAYRDDAGDSSAAADATAWPDATMQPEGGRADASTCGPCDGECFGTRCLIVLASHQANPESIAVTSRGVYWMNRGTPDTQYAESAVMWVALDGGPFALIAPAPGGTSNEVVADDSLIAWSHNGVIESVAADLHAPPGVVVANADAYHLAMDDAGIYWTGHPQSSGINAAAWRVGRDGANPKELMEGAGIPAPILVSDGVVYWQAYDGDGNYTTTFYAIPALGGAPQTVAAGMWSGEYPWTILAGGIYWGDTANPLELHRVGIDGGPSVVVASQFEPAAMTSDDTAIYFTNDNSLYEMPADGGAPVAIAWRFGSPYAIAVDATSVYFTDIGTCDAGACSGTIYKLTPK